MSLVVCILITFTIFIASFKDKYTNREQAEKVIAGNIAIVGLMVVLHILRGVGNV